MFASLIPWNKAIGNEGKHIRYSESRAKVAILEYGFPFLISI
tara:strand:- start:1691 stop:1816 length:126 start_codon:yes stop_codon:yes gene_type:complete